MKKGVSLIVSYVLLVVIALSLAIVVYSWLKFIAEGAEDIEKCPKSVSFVIQDYECLADKKIQLNMKNKGFFNISGYAIKGAEDKNKVAWFKLKETDALERIELDEGYLFLNPLPPNAAISRNFSYDGLTTLEKVEIEPIRVINKEVILCENAIVSQEVDCS